MIHFSHFTRSSSSPILERSIHHPMTADYYVRGDSSESPAMWNLTSLFSYQASEAVSSELWCQPLANLKVLDGEGRVSGQRGGQTQGAVAVDVLPSDALHFLGHGTVDGAERALVCRLRETNRVRGRDTWSLTGLQHNPSQSRPHSPSGPPISWCKSKSLEAVSDSFREIIKINTAVALSLIFKLNFLK